MKIDNRNAIISIAGTVGVGKSSLTQKLAERLDFKTSFENVEKNPYLDKYYNDFGRWGFHLQVFFLAERYKEQKRMYQYGGGFIQDRTIYEDLEIFAKMNYDNNSMSPEDYQTYQELFAAMVYSPYFNPPDLIIYIEGTFDEIMNRINIRGREMEKDTDIEYWRNLYKRYITWIEEFNLCPVLRINISEYDINDDNSIDLIIEKANKILEKK